MNYTTIEQSRKLLELGLNPETADMFWQSNLNGSDRQYLLDIGKEEYFDIEINSEHCSIGNYDIPAWSLDTLLELMPDEISTGKEWSNKYQIDIRKYAPHTYQIAYGNNRGFSKSWHDMINTKECDNFLEACYNMVVWLLENNYIKKI